MLGQIARDHHCHDRQHLLEQVGRDAAFLRGIGSDRSAAVFRSENLAKDIIADLNKGKKFNELAKQYSMDAMAQQGGDLGWLGAHQMPEPYAKAVQSLEKGKYTASPIKSDFGWHVIRLEDTRTPQPPAYEDVKDQIKGALQGQMINDYIATLKAKATIQIK